MAETMYAAPGLGLAANQVGELQRLIVFDVAHQDGGPRDLQVILNPCITAGEGEIIHEEGCLSVADFSAEVRRHARVTGQGAGPGRQTPGNYRRGVAGGGAPARDRSSGRHSVHRPHQPAQAGALFKTSQERGGGQVKSGPWRLIFMGTPQFALPSLEALLAAGKRWPRW